MSACSKFIPNFFNKNKCQNCFKFRTCHNDQKTPLDQNQIVRTIVRCNFLFITSECHSTLITSINKIRKFQRRWFILYSNGELTYSLDQSSLTLPQNRILLTECDHISLAPDVHEFAIAIVYLDKVYYIRANHQEETQRWLDDLSQFVTNSKMNAETSSKNLQSQSTAGKQCVVVDAVHKVNQEHENDALNSEQNQECQSKNTGEEKRNPIFKLLSYVNYGHNDQTNSELDIRESDRQGDHQSDRQGDHQSDRQGDHQTDQQDEQILITNDDKMRIHCVDDSRQIVASQQCATLIKSPKRNKSLPDLRTTQRDHKTKENKSNSNEKSRNQKSSWLMRRRDQTSKEWYRHWFVLNGTLLTYYRDRPTIESNSLLNGVFDLSLIKRVHCSTVCLTLNQTIYYPFTILYNNQEHELASLSSECRDEWIKLIVDSSQSQLIPHSQPYDNVHNAIDSRTNSDVETDESTSSSTNEVFSNFSDKKHHQMPSSPPLNRNAISRMKHKSKDNKISNCKSTNKAIKLSKSSSLITDCSSISVNKTNCVNEQSIDNQVDSGLASSDDLILNLDSPIQQSNEINNAMSKKFDQSASIETMNGDNELSRIEYSIAELHKFCLTIVNELQLTHSDLTQLKQNLIQKDFFGLLLSSKLLNGSQVIDTYAGQLFDTLMSNLIKQSDQTPLDTLADRQPFEQLENRTFDHISSRHQTENKAEQNRTKSSNQIEQPTLCNQSTFQSEDETDRIYLTRKQFDSLLNKNEQLEHRLRISLKTLQSLNSELKESNENYDHLEILFLYVQNKFRSIIKIKQDEYDLMKLKIDYLTSKLVAVEKAYRSSLSKLAELERTTS